MFKVFISVGMTGRNEKDVLDDIQKCKDTFISRHGNLENVIFIHNYDAISDGRKLSCLGEAVAKLGECDFCIFSKDYYMYRGCRVELKVCELYGIEIDWTN